MAAVQKVLSVFGTRPEAIKMAPVVAALAASPEFDARVCVTAQHREMLDQVLELFGLDVDHDLDLMSAGQSPTEVLSRVVADLEPVLAAERPDWVLVQGDTTTAMAASLAAVYAGARVGHVEAGLRTFDRRRPFPEELNRLVVGAVADLHFAPTEQARANLLREGKTPESVLVCGNTVIDALLTVAGLDAPVGGDPLEGVAPDRDVVLVTAHRRENFGAPFAEVCEALAELATTFADGIQIVYPVHPNPRVADVARARLSGLPNATLCEPLDYHRLVQVMRRARLVITDSGGIQEEAPSLGVPVLVLRDVTERPEAVDAGTVELVGCDRATIVKRAAQLLTDAAAHDAMARRTNPYGDGHAAPRIVDALAGRPVEEFRPAG
ncbi:MAG: UDP-N-acetylglucosamine 2-epimerase (non-hydrolyzing) [Acidimicrobiales bacterium]